MNRRRVLLGLLSAAITPAVRAQPVSRLRTIGFLSGRSPDTDRDFVTAFQAGLAEAGYVVGRDIAIDYHAADGSPGRLRDMAAAMVRRGVALIFASSTGSALAAKAVTTTIPIVFTGASDPVAVGLVPSLARPGGNLTGVTMFSHAFGPKRLELLHEILPDESTVAILSNPTNPSTADEYKDLQSAARSLGIQTVAFEARSDAEIEAAFAALNARGVRALYILDDPLYTARAAKLGTLANRHAIATISTLREVAQAGGIGSYGTSFVEVHRQCGVYAGRILGGAAPGGLPVALPSRFMLVINLESAASMGLTIPRSILLRADEVIE